MYQLSALPRTAMTGALTKAYLNMAMRNPAINVPKLVHATSAQLIRSQIRENQAQTAAAQQDAALLAAQAQAARDRAAAEAAAVAAAQQAAQPAAAQTTTYTQPAATYAQAAATGGGSAVSPMPATPNTPTDTSTGTAPGLSPMVLVAIGAVALLVLPKLLGRH